MPDSNKSRWVKPAVRTTAPARLAAVIVRARPAADTEGRDRVPVVWDGAAVAWSARRRGEWSAARTESLPTGRALLTRLVEMATPRSVLWVVSPSASSALTLAGFWEWLLESGAKWSGRGESRDPSRDSRPACQAGTPRPPAGSEPGQRGEAADTDKPIVSSLCATGKTDVIRYTVGTKTIVWVSASQYFTAVEESLATTAGFDWPRSGGPVPVGTVVARDPADRAELWLRVFQRLGDWWRSIDGGPWGATPGAMAMSYVRRRLAPRSVLSCQDPTVRAVEESAIFGGRATTWDYSPFVSKYSDSDDYPDTLGVRPLPPKLAPVDHWDVRSMYPTILVTEDFPARFLHQWDQPTPSQLADMLSRWCVIATVEVQTWLPEYPVRDGGRLSFPVGRFRTTLTTPELADALADGAVVRCFRALTYQRGRPFAGAVGELIAQRADAAGRGDAASEMFVKLLSNSFGGKLAQRLHEWQRRPGVHAELDWGEWIHDPGDGGGPRRYRSRSGLVDEHIRSETPTRPLAACFAHLTAYGRQVMRRVRESIPPAGLVSQDTDGVWVSRRSAPGWTPAAAVRLPPAYRLRLTRTARRGRWYGPRHYWTDHGWTLAGMHDPRRWGDGLRFRDSYCQLPVNTGEDRPPVWVYECSRYVRLGEIPADGEVGPDGRLSPRKVHLM